jgi:hypothetical protein
MEISSGSKGMDETFREYATLKFDYFHIVRDHSNYEI